MPIQEWSDKIWVADVGDEPQFSEDMQSLKDKLRVKGPCAVVIDMKAVRALNSSSVGLLVRLRQKLVQADKHLRLCNVPDSVWAMMLVTGLDKVFEFSPDLSSALAGLQLDD